MDLGLESSLSFLGGWTFEGSFSLEGVVGVSKWLDLCGI